jgi:hypothetical protein
MIPAVVKKDGREYTEKQEKFLDALYEDPQGNINNAMVKAGYKEGAGSTALVKSLQQEIVEIATLILARNAPKAANKLVDIMESNIPIPQANQKLNAAQSLLDRVGVIKESRVSVDHTVTGGIFVMPAKDNITIDMEDAEVIND